MSPKPGTNEKTGTNGKCRKPLIYRGLKEFVPKFVPAEKKPIGYLIFLSPLFFSFGDKFGDKMKETPKVWAFLAFSICPHILRAGTNGQKSPILRAFSKGPFCPRFSCSGDKRGQNRFTGTFLFRSFLLFSGTKWVMGFSYCFQISPFLYGQSGSEVEHIFWSHTRISNRNSNRFVIDMACPNSL